MKYAIALFMAATSWHPVLCATEAAAENTMDDSAIAGLDAPQNSSDAASGMRLEVEAAYASKYLFQGFDYSDGRAVFPCYDVGQPKE